MHRRRPLRRTLVAALGLAVLAATALPASAQETPPPAPAQQTGTVDGWPQYALTAERPHLGPQPTSSVFRADVTATVAGLTRTFRVHVPAGLTGPAPVLIGLHGLYQSRQTNEERMRFMRDAAARRTIVVYPSGSSGSWNGGRCCGRAAKDGVDDVRWLQTVVDEIAYAHPVDRRRVYAAGFSNGGMLAYRTACQAPGFLAAYAVVGGAYMSASWCRPTTATPVMVVHGQKDTVVRYGGERYSDYLKTSVPSVAQSVAVVKPVNDRAGARTLLVTLPEEGHRWPTTATAGRYDTTRHVQNFLLRYRSPA